MMGNQDPCARIAPKYDKTDGMRATKLLSLGGMILDPWQSDILDDWMALTVSGKWISKTCGGSVPRQNGKTGLVAGRSEAGMMLYNEQVLYTAHLQKTATETFEEMANFFDSDAMRKYLKDIKQIIEYNTEHNVVQCQFTFVTKAYVENFSLD